MEHYVNWVLFQDFATRCLQNIVQLFCTWFYAWYTFLSTVVSHVSRISVKSIPFKRELQIRDTVVRIRIRGSVPLTYGSGFGSCSFRQLPARCQQIIILFFYVFCLLLFEGTSTSVFKDKKS
jgi:hypothetical protein